MVIVQAILGFITRSLGKLLNTAFGWATTMLFGKVPENRQIHISVVAFGSVIWIVAVLGVIFPSVATFLLTFVTLPKWVDRAWIRLAMLAAAAVIPLVVGVVSLLMLDPAQRPESAGDKLKAVLNGYPYTLGLATTLILMTIFAPIMKAQDVVRRWSTTHIPVVVDSKDYMTVVGAVQRALARGDIRTVRTGASWMMKLPTKILTKLAGGAIENLVADELTTLKGKDVEITLHPSDLVVRGRERQAMRAHAILTEHLAFTPAHLTWSKAANELEDRLRAIWESMRADTSEESLRQAAERLQMVERDLRTVEIPYEEWEVLFREKLLVERGLLQVAAGISDKPLDPAEARPEAIGAAAFHKTERKPFPAVPIAAAAGALAVVAWKTVTGRKAA